MSDLFLAIDIGGTKLTVATLLAGEQEWDALARAFSPVAGRMEDDWRLIVMLSERVLAGRKPAGIGVSFGGPADFRTGIVQLSHHVPGWEQMPLAARLSTQFKAPCLIDNDAAVAALGEHQFGAGRGIDHLFYVTVSTGVGGGWILNGEPWRGPQGLAGEIGHVVVEPTGPRCLCGKQGCVERLASGPYMAQDARERMAVDGGSGTILRDLAGGELEQVDGKLVAQAAERGDSLAIELLERGAKALGVGIGAAVNFVNPNRIILGGGVTKSGPQWWYLVDEAARATALPEFQFDIVPAELGDEAPLWGAAVLSQWAALT